MLAALVSYSRIFAIVGDSVQVRVPENACQVFIYRAEARSVVVLYAHERHQ
jgi:hypothetical protein